MGDAARAADGAGSDDAGMDAALDTGMDGADGASSIPDASGPTNALFAHIGGQLVSVNPGTGSLTEVGPTGQSFIVLAWDEVARVVRAVTDPYSAVGSTASPRLGVIDLCTGKITGSVPFSVGGTPVRRVEGLARDPDTGVFWLTYGISGTAAATQFLSESLGTVDVTTGAVTRVGEYQTYQNDGDLLVFEGDNLVLLDVATATNQGALYDVDPATARAALRANTGPTLVRIAPDPTRGVVFGAVGATNFTQRGIVTVDTHTGARTPIGSLPDDVYPGVQFTSLISVPAPECPSP